MIAKIKLAARTKTKTAASEPVPASPPAAGDDLHEAGRQWMSGASIKTLARRFGCGWPELQRRLRSLGYFRAPVSLASP